MKDLSTVSFQRLLDTFAVTFHEGGRVGSLRHEHQECDYLKNVASFVQKTQVIITYLKGKGLYQLFCEETL